MAQKYTDAFAGLSLGETDPIVKGIIDLEADRQLRRIILIPSESLSPAPVREALGSQFQNIYCEGYPPLRLTREEEDKVLDTSWQLARYRRYADRRFYKGCDYANFIEVLAQRRAANQIFVNVQPLSGAAANNSVYEALCKPGDVVMGMSLTHGGHLSHGSPFNRSGKRYKIVSYEIDSKTELLDYDRIAEMAKEHRPKMIIAGFTSYPFAPDWKKFSEIAKSVGASTPTRSGMPTS
jgi:glycine hydroxymethyltransferase